ncbi:MAG: hypothetical protein ACREPM_19270 [Gemmatimonadaceae bacterium]
MLGPPQPAPYSSSLQSAAWTNDLAQRLRSLLHATPLTDLRSSDEHHDISTRHYDSLTLALKLLDAVVEYTGLEDELDHDGARRMLAPLLRAMDHAAGVEADVDRHDAVVRRLLAALQNDKSGREPFDVTYLDAGERGELVTRHVTFRLLSDYHVGGPGDGRIVLRLSNEAINLVLNALSLDLADAHAATEAVVDSQFRRGRFDDALRSAQNARIRSVNYSRSIDEQLERTQRDVRRVDWRETMPRMLDDARIHIELRLHTEDRILEAAEPKLDELPLGSEQAMQVAQIVSLMKDCRRRHMELHGRLMRARAIFLEAQGRQAFVAARAFARPDLTGKVLTPVLRMTARAASVLAETAFHLCHPPVPPNVFGFSEYVHYLIRPKREIGLGSRDIAPRDLVSYGSDPAFFSPEVRAAALVALSAVDVATPLSALLRETTAATVADPVADLIAFVTLRAFAPDRFLDGDGEPKPEARARGMRGATAAVLADPFESDPLLDLMSAFDIEPIPGSELRVAGYIGDDLRLVRRLVPSTSDAGAAVTDQSAGVFNV